MDPTPSTGATSGAPSPSCAAVGPRVPPRRNGSRMKKAAAPLSPRVATAGSCSSFSGSGVSPEIASVVTSQPMGGDDCAINDLLEGRTDLCLVLPDNRQVLVNVERRTPVMDLLVQVATANKINPSGHVIQVANDKGYDAVCKPNTPVGSLDVKELFIVPKTSSTHGDLPHKRATRRAVQPFEPTFRLQVRLPRNQLAVLRVTLGTTLGRVKQTVCEDKGLNPQGYQLVALGRPPVAPLDPALTLEQFGAAEVGLMSNRALAASIQNSATDLISYSITKDSKKGIIGLLTHHRSKGSLTGSSSDSVSSRGTSPARSDPLALVSSTPLQSAPTAPCRAPVKKRPAPQPPVQSHVSNKESDRSADNAVAGVSGERGVTRTHSRQSSDSSGYHEASVLSDLPETPSPEMVCGSSGMGSVDTPPHSLEVARPRRDKGPSKPRPDSLASDASLGHGKKRRAPPPPVAEVSPSTDSMVGSTCGGGTTSARTLPTHNEVKQEPNAGFSGERTEYAHAEGKGENECSERAPGSAGSQLEEALTESSRKLINPTPRPRLTLRRKQVSADEGLYENSRILKEGEDRCREPEQSTSCPLSAGAESSGVTIGPDAILHRTSTQDEATMQEEIMLQIDASFGAIEGDSTDGGITTTYWDYDMPEPPSPFRSTAPLGLTMEGIISAEEVTEVIADAVSDGLHEEFDNSSLVDSGHVENFSANIDEPSESAEPSIEHEVQSSAGTCSMSEMDTHLSMERGGPTNNENLLQSEVSRTEDRSPESVWGEGIVSVESANISGRTVSDCPPLTVEEAAVQVAAAQEQTKDDVFDRSPTSSKTVLSKAPNVGSETVMTTAADELRIEGPVTNGNKISGVTAPVHADAAVVSPPTDNSLARGADALSSRPPNERSDTLTRSRSMNCGPVSFSIGSYGSYKTETVDNIFSDEPGQVKYDRFKNIKVACSPSMQNIVKKTKEVAIKENSIETAAPTTEAAVAAERKSPTQCRPPVRSGFTVRISEKQSDDTSGTSSNDGEKSLVARSSSMLDLRESVAAAPKQPKPREHPGIGKTCLADEKETLLSEYAKLQLQFVAWQQQLATNQNLLEDKNIVPSVVSTTSHLSSRTEKGNCDIPRRNTESGSTLQRPRAHRPVSLLVEANRPSFPVMSAPRVQLGSWTERQDNLPAAMNFGDKTCGPPEFLSTRLTSVKKSNDVSGHAVVQSRGEADVQDVQGTPRPQTKPKTSLPAMKCDSRPVPRKPTGILYSAPTVRGFSQEAVSKFVGEMMLEKKEGHCINRKATQPFSSSPDTDIRPKIATRDVPSQKETSPVNDLPKRPAALVPTEQRAQIAKDITSEKLRIRDRIVTSPKAEEKRVHRPLSGLRSEMMQSARIPSATMDANKPSVVRATLKSGVTTTAVVPPPPPPPLPLNGCEESRRKVPNGRPKSIMEKDLKPVPMLMDPREVLMNEIRSFGGKSSLKKVSTEPAWQLNICNLRSAPV